MTKEELLYNWENQLVLFDIAIMNAEDGPPLIASILDYQKKQLMACIEDLKQLNGEVRQAPIKSNSITKGSCSHMDF